MRVAQDKAHKMSGSSGDLLYVSDGKNNIRVLTFPQGDLVQTLTNVEQPEGQCSDRNGNVFISDWGEPGSLAEFAHGGSTIVNVLHMNGLDSALACSVDATTGNVATTAEGLGWNISVFIAGNGPPIEYNDPLIKEYISCAYDRDGNLYVDGENNSTDFILAVLPRGSSEFTTITLDPQIKYGWGLQWDNGYLLVSEASQSGTTVYQVKITGSTGKIVSTTSLQRSRSGYTLVHGNTIVAEYALKRSGRHRFETKTLGLWGYPNGGRATKVFPTSNFRHKSNITGFSISVAPSDR